jgi:beta-N-acetylhexosaminidase
MKPVIFGCSGTELTPEERDFFATAKPLGFILFQRNCKTPDQVKGLVNSLRAYVPGPNEQTCRQVRSDSPPLEGGVRGGGERPGGKFAIETLIQDAPPPPYPSPPGGGNTGAPGCSSALNIPVFIDQEGGRVARLKPPYWPSLPSMRVIGRLYERDAERGLEAMRLHAQLTARQLTALGINGNCAPVLDLFVDGASSAIGDRAFSRKPEHVAVLGRVAVDTYLANGVLPVIKHMPGHGRVKDDPHLTLPTVDTERDVLEAEDFAPFKALRDTPLGMNCHAVFKALDPDKPVSLSAKVHREVIRGVLGFEGLLLSDDLAMKALNGPLPQIACQALEAGADVVLYCPGTLPKMRAIAEVLPEMNELALARWARAKARLGPASKGGDLAVDQSRLEAMTNICD